jgi:hypothetical protein
MRVFKLMAEAARRPGMFIKVTTDKHKPLQVSDEEKRIFWERMAAARIFVFNQGEWDMPEVVHAEESPDLDLPFQTCFFENLKDLDGRPFMIKVDNNGQDAVIGGILLHEIAPTQYDCYYLYYSARGILHSVPRVVLNSNDLERGNPVAWVSQLFLDKLRHSDLGVEEVREKVKLGSGTGEKVFHPIRKIIRVAPKGQRASVLPAFSREIDWSHRWAVRGHWRRIGGLGKNRAGEYCVQGFTWVSDFVKGPEGAPLVEKVRVVMGSEPLKQSG